MSNISDVIKIHNTDISGIDIFPKGNIVYMNRFDVNKLAEANHISDIDKLCTHILEQHEYSPEKTKYVLVAEHEYNPEFMALQLKAAIDVIVEEGGKLSAKERKELPTVAFGIPNKKAFPMPDKDHVLAAIRMFNRASESDQPELARNIKKKIKEFNMEDDVKVSSQNKFSKFWHGVKSESAINEEFITEGDSIELTPDALINMAKGFVGGTALQVSDEILPQTGIERHKAADTHLGIKVGKLREAVRIIFNNTTKWLRNSDYKSSDDIKERIRIVKRAIDDVNREIKKVEHDDPSKQYGFQEIIKLLVSLGAATALEVIIPGFGVGAWSKIFTIYNGIKAIYTGYHYRNALLGYKHELEYTLDYLERAYVRQVQKEKEAAMKAKASSFNRRKV